MDPARWLDREDLPAALRHALEDDAALEPPPDAQAEVLGAVFEAVASAMDAPDGAHTDAGASQGAGAAETTGAGAAGGLGSKVGVLAIVGIGTLGTVLAVIMWSGEQPHRPAPAQPPAPAATSLEARPPAQAPAPTHAEAPSELHAPGDVVRAPARASDGTGGARRVRGSGNGRRRERRAPQTEQAPTYSSSDPAGEEELVVRARASLHAGDFDRTLALIEELERRHPDAALAPEGAMLRIRALQGLRRDAEARAAARRFLTRYPGSPYAEALGDLLEPASSTIEP